MLTVIIERTINDVCTVVKAIPFATQALADEFLKKFSDIEVPSTACEKWKASIVPETFLFSYSQVPKLLNAVYVKKSEDGSIIGLVEKTEMLTISEIELYRSQNKNSAIVYAYDHPHNIEPVSVSPEEWLRHGLDKYMADRLSIDVYLSFNPNLTQIVSKGITYPTF